MAEKKVKKEEETKIETEETGVQFGYVYQGKLVDLVPHSDADSTFDKLTADADALAKLLSITLGGALFEITANSSKEEADDYKKYLLKAIGDAAQHRADELMADFNKAINETLETMGAKKNIDVPEKSEPKVEQKVIVDNENNDPVA